MLQETNSYIILYYFAGNVFILLLVAAIVTYIFLHQKKVTFFRMKMQVEEIKKQEAVFVALQKGEEKERNRIAEELHDGISAKLSGLNMNLDYMLSNKDEAHDKSLINKTHEGINEVIHELREISHNIYPEFLIENDLQTSLQKFTEQLNSKNGCKYSLFYEMAGIKLDNNLKLHSYRIITELLHNVHKHALAKHASVQINNEQEHILIIVEDDGKGFFPEIQTSTNGIGLQNIHNRVHVCSGTINIDSSTAGTTIIVNIPFNVHS